MLVTILGLPTGTRACRHTNKRKWIKHTQTKQRKEKRQHTTRRGKKELTRSGMKKRKYVERLKLNKS